MVSSDGCVALPCGAVGLSAISSVVFPDHTHLLFSSDEAKLYTYRLCQGQRYSTTICVYNIHIPVLNYYTRLNQW